MRSKYRDDELAMFWNALKSLYSIRGSNAYWLMSWRLKSGVIVSRPTILSRDPVRSCHSDAYYPYIIM